MEKMNKVYIVSFDFYHKSRYHYASIQPELALKMMDSNSLLHIAIFASKQDAESYVSLCNARPDLSLDFDISK